MRVTESLRFQSLQQNLQSASAKLSGLYEQMATQQSVSRPSDDPVKTAAIMRLNSALNAFKQNNDSMKNAQTFMDSATSRLEAVQDKLIQARTLAVRAGNSTLSEHECKAIAGQINELLESILQDANTKFDDRFIFAGTKTDSAPFVATRDTDGKITSISYQGNTQDLHAPIGRDRTATLSVTGKAAYVDTGLLQSLINFRDDLENAGSMTSDQLATAMTNDLGAISDATDSLGVMTSVLAARASEIDILADQNDAAIVRAQEQLSNKRDADMAQLAIDLNRQQMVYQALISAGGRIVDKNLMDYI